MPSAIEISQSQQSTFTNLKSYFTQTFTCKLSARNFALLTIFTILLSYLLGSIILTSSSSNKVDVSKLPNILAEQRLFVPLVSGRIGEGFSFSESRIIGSSALVTISLRPSPLNPGNLNFEINKNKISLPLIQNSVHIETLSSGSDINIKYIHPPDSESNPALDQIVISPKNILLLPTLKFAAPLVFSITLIFIAISALFSSKSHTNYLSIPITAAVITYILWGTELDDWILAACAIATTSFLILGVVLSKLNIEHTQVRFKSRYTWRCSLLAVLLFGFAVRLTGLYHGLPNFYHPDEARKYQVATRIINSDDLNPKYFRHPSFLVYSTALAGRIIAWIENKEPSEIFPSRPGRIILSHGGRIVSLITGTVTLLITALIARLLFSDLAALLATALCAASPLLTVTSRYVKEDSPLLFFTLLSFYFALKALRDESFKNNILKSSLIGGLSASAKYSGVLSLFFSFYVFASRLYTTINSYKIKNIIGSFINSVRNDFIIGIICLVAFAAGFIIITPYAVLDSQTFIADFINEKMHMQRGHAGAISAAKSFWSYHLYWSILPAISTPSYIAAMIGVGLLAWRHRKTDLLIVITILLFYLPAEWVKAKPEPQPERYIVPCIPFLALAASALFNLFQNYLTIFNISRRNLLLSIAFIVLVIPSAVFNLNLALSLNHDTRKDASYWIENNIPEGSTILMDWKYYGPEISKDKYHVIEIKVGEGSKLQKSLSVSTLQKAGIQYIVFSNFYYRRYLKPSNRFNFMNWRIRRLFSELTELTTIEKPQSSYGFHNPTIKIFKVEPLKIP